MRSSRRLPSLAVLLFLALLGPGRLAGQRPADEGRAERERLARELLETTGSSDLGMQVLTQVVESFKASNPAVPEEFWRQFLAEVDADQLVELSIPIYVEHLTETEMKAAIAFYSTPEGAAILSKMPAILAESMQAGQAWGADIAQRVMERLQSWKEAHPES